MVLISLFVGFGYPPINVVMDFLAKTVTLAMNGTHPVVWWDAYIHVLIWIISYIWDKRFLSRYCMAYPTYVSDISIKSPSFDFVLIVHEFHGVFFSDQLAFLVKMI